MPSENNVPIISCQKQDYVLQILYHALFKVVSKVNPSVSLLKMVTTGKLVKVGHMSHLAFEIRSFQEWSRANYDIETLNNFTFPIHLIFMLFMFNCYSVSHKKMNLAFDIVS